MKGFRTIAMYVLIILIMLVQHFADNNLLPKVSVETYVIILAALNLVLRFFTDTPVFSKQQSGQLRASDSSAK